ncbi:MAG: carboxypeptidase regulatory-like domain-containing protein [Methanosarcinaceae archaeon]|nr:carboxypeptidase regulatory-like domain-containing protein [Methanosarcinaceae archaeon]
MKCKNRLFNDDSAIELPINIVVMLVVGMVALAALIAIIPPPTKNMSVDIQESGLSTSVLTSGNTIIVDAVTAQNPLTILVKIRAMDPDGEPVRDANVVLRGLGGVATNSTDINGETTLTTNSAPIEFGANQNEGTMDLTISANGFYDYEKTDAVMIIKTK